MDLKYVLGLVSLFAASTVGLGYLAIGDSFTSGEGETSDAYYLKGTNEVHRKCHISSRSYPFLLAQRAGRASQAKSVACSGAQIQDVVGEGSYEGQGSRLGKSGSNLVGNAVTMRQQQALLTFQPGETRQGEFLARYRPEAVTVGIGGNDIGMFDKLKSCMMPGTCEWAYGDYLTQFGREINGIYKRLTRLYHQLQAASPGTRFYVLGYPQVINPIGLGCDPIVDRLLDSTERLMFVQAISYLNTVIRVAASDWASMVYVPVDQAFDGHRLCDGGQRAVNSIRIGDDSQLIGSIMLGNESFHPTPYGHELIANHIEFIVQLNSPKTGAVSGDETAPAPGVPAYWSDDERILARIVRESFAVSELILGGNTVQLVFQAGSFLAGTPVRVSIHSDVRELASVTADAYGGVDVLVTIPSDMQGYHTLHAVGVSPGRDEVDYYQSVVIQYQSNAAEEARNVNNYEHSTVAQYDPPDSPQTQDDGGVLGTRHTSSDAQVYPQKQSNIVAKPRLGDPTFLVAITAVTGVLLLIIAWWLAHPGRGS